MGTLQELNNMSSKDILAKLQNNNYRTTTEQPVIADASSSSSLQVGNG